MSMKYTKIIEVSDNKWCKTWCKKNKIKLFKMINFLKKPK